MAESDPGELTDEQPNQADPAPDQPRSPISVAMVVVVGLVVTALVVAGLVFASRRGEQADPPAPPSSTIATPTPTPSITPPPSPTPTPTPKPKPSVPAGCSPSQAPMAKPTGFAIPRLKAKSKVLSLGWDGGAPAAPPLNSASAATDVGWFNQGPKLGSAKGNVILTIHTYRHGGALGNRLQSSFKKGDQVRFTDASGRVLCYTLEATKKVWVASYDPESKVMFDPEGKPQAVIVICWDFNWNTLEWDSRLMFYLKPVGTPAR